MSIDKNQLFVGNKGYNLTLFRWYVLEIYPKTQELKNIVFLTEKGHMIYTFNDSIDNIASFLDVVNEYLDIFDNYPQGTFEKMSRKMKL